MAIDRDQAIQHLMIHTLDAQEKHPDPPNVTEAIRSLDRQIGKLTAVAASADQQAAAPIVAKRFLCIAAICLRSVIAFGETPADPTEKN